MSSLRGWSKGVSPLMHRVLEVVCMILASGFEGGCIGSFFGRKHEQLRVRKYRGEGDGFFCAHIENRVLAMQGFQYLCA